MTIARTLGAFAAGQSEIDPTMQRFVRFSLFDWVTVGIAGVAAMMALAGGLDTAVALGLWAVLAGRAIAAIPTIRSQVLKLHGRPTKAVLPVAADLVALALVAATAIAEPALIAGAVAVAVAIVAQRALIAWAPTERAVVLGIRQTVMGLAVVIATAVGVGLA